MSTTNDDDRVRNSRTAADIGQTLRYYLVRAYATGIELVEEDGRNLRYGFFQNFWIWAVGADGAKRQVVSLLSEDTAIQAQRSSVVVRYDIEMSRSANRSQAK